MRNRKQHFTYKSLLSELQGAFGAILYAFALIYFVDRLMGNVTPDPLAHWLTVIMFVLAFGVAITLWKITIPAILVFAIVVMASYLLQWDFGNSIFSATFWIDLWEKLYRGVRWAITWNTEKGAMPTHYYSALVLLASLIGTVFIWKLPTEIFSIGLFVVPLFLLGDLTVNPNWILWFFVGLFAVFIAASKSWLPLRSHRLSIVVGAAVLLLTFTLGSILPKESIYIPSLHEWLQQFDQTTPSNGIKGFSLAEVGFHPAGNKIGGPVTLTNTPFLDYTSSNPSPVYLRGATFDHFEDGGWNNGGRRSLYPFINNVDFVNDYTSLQSQLFWFPSEHDVNNAISNSNGLFRLELYSVTPKHDMQVVFHGAKSAIIELGSYDFQVSPDSIASLIKHVQPGVSYDYTGAIYADQSHAPDGYYAMDLMQTKDLIEAAPWLRSEEYLPKRDDNGARQYEAIVRAADPELAAIVYDASPEQDAYAILSAMKTHFEAKYTYNLEVPFIPEDTPFIQWFLSQKEGYCVYFASAWTLLLQDIGYEARYAEGFVVPTGESISLSTTSDASESPTLAGVTDRREVSTDRAHAWTELLIEGLGWMRVETTNASHVDELSNITSGTAADPNSTESTEQHESSIEEPIVPPTLEESSEESSQSSETLLDGPALPEGMVVGFPGRTIAILPWILGMILIAVVLWMRHRQFKKLHDSHTLLDRFEGNYADLVKRIWNDMLRLAQLANIKIVASDTPDKILSTISQKLQKEPTELHTRKCIIDVLYGAKEIDRTSAASVKTMYDEMERWVKKEANPVRWYMARILFRRPF